MADGDSRKRSPNQESADQHPNKQVKADDVSIKFLLPNIVVGALLSRKAAALKRIKDQTCHGLMLTLSGKTQLYPGTNEERMISLVGNPPMIHRACCLLQDQVIEDPFLVHDEAGTTDIGPRQGMIKIAVSDRAASKIIGSRGVVIKDISSHFNIVINITPAKDVLVENERVVTIIGPSRNIYDALEPIIYQISEHPVQISPEFDYYDQHTKESKGNPDVTEKQNDIEVEGEIDDSFNDEIDLEIKIEDKLSLNIELDEELDSKTVTERSELDLPQEPSDEKEKQVEKKKFNRTPKKVGRWIWQNAPRSRRPAWVWVDENEQQNMNFSRHSMGGYPIMGQRY